MEAPILIFSKITDSTKVNYTNMIRYLAKGIVVFLVVVLCLVTASTVALLLRPYREYQVYKMREQAYAERVEAARVELKQREEYLQLVLNDPEFLERVVRERLGYVRENEQIFRFDTAQ